MSASDYLELKFLDHLFGKATFSSPTVYIALCTAAPTDTSTGSTLTEANYTGYARRSTAASDWNAASSGTTSNANTLSFASCTGGSSTVTHFALVDASSSGNVLCWGALTSSLSVSSGDSPQVATGAMTITLD